MVSSRSAISWLVTTALLAVGACGSDDLRPSGDGASGGGAGTGAAPAVTNPVTATAGATATSAAAGSGGRPGATAPTAGATSAGAKASAGTTATATAAGSGGTATPSAGAGGTATAGAAGSAGAGMSDPVASGREPASKAAYPIMMEHHMEAPIFNIRRPMDLSATGAPLPVVIWANGGCYRSDFTWSPLFDRWAKGGFAVLSLASNGAEDDILSMLGTSSKEDHAALIDWVVAQNASGPYAGKLDVERIIVTGNSCGGVTALQVAADEAKGKDRLAAVFVLSGSSALGSVDANIMKAIQIPVGYIVGGSEDIAGANATGDYEAMSEGVPAMIVNRRAGDHQTVSTDPMIAPEVAEIALNWMDLAVFGTKPALDALMSDKHCDNCTAGDWMIKSKNLEKLVK